jgi:hypothetical protein
MMKKFTQRVLILAAAEVSIVGVISGVNLVGQVSADPGTCIGATASCQQIDLNSPQSQGRVVCQPTGPKAGAVCREFVPHSA